MYYRGQRNTNHHPESPHESVKRGSQRLPGLWVIRPLRASSQSKHLSSGPTTTTGKETTATINKCLTMRVPPPPPSLIPPESLRLQTPHSHPHTTTHYNMRDGGDLRLPPHIPDLNHIHSQARPHGAATCNTLRGGDTRASHCIPQALRHVHGDYPTGIICNNAALRLTA